MPRPSFRPSLTTYMFVYLDNILIFSPREEHIYHVQTILQCLLEYSLFVKAKQCSFLATSLSFLGYIIGLNRLEMDPAKVFAVTSWPIPNSQKQMQ